MASIHESTTAWKLRHNGPRATWHSSCTFMTGHRKYKNMGNKTPILSIDRLNTLTRSSWPEYTTFDAATYFKWPGAAIYLYPVVSPKLYPDGATTPQQILDALCAKGVLVAGPYALLVTEEDLHVG